MKSNKKPKPVEIRIDKNGGFKVVDMDAFFAQPEVQKTRELLKKMDLAGKRLNGNKIELQDDTQPKKR